MKTHVALFKAKATGVMEGAETARNPITDEMLERMQPDNARFVDAGLVRFSRQLHYLLAQLTTDSARLEDGSHCGCWLDNWTDTGRANCQCGVDPTLHCGDGTAESSHWIHSPVPRDD